MAAEVSDHLVHPSLDERNAMTRLPSRVIRRVIRRVISGVISGVISRSSSVLSAAIIVRPVFVSRGAESTNQPPWAEAKDSGRGPSPILLTSRLGPRLRTAVGGPSPILLTVQRSYVGNDVTCSVLLDRACACSYNNLPECCSYWVSNTAACGLRSANSGGLPSVVCL